MRVIDIVPGTSVDGPGLRTSIYFAGCHHACPGCYNPQSWPIDAGKEMTVGEIAAIVSEHGFDVTFTGGDPIYQGEELVELARTIHSQGKTIWCYTGFLFDQLFSIPSAMALLPYLEVVVDGPFVEALRDISLQFRGSSNQRLVDVGKSTHDQVVEWGNDFTELFF